MPSISTTRKSRAFRRRLLLTGLCLVLSVTTIGAPIIVTAETYKNAFCVAVETCDECFITGTPSVCRAYSCSDESVEIWACIKVGPYPFTTPECDGGNPPDHLYCDSCEMWTCPQSGSKCENCYCEVDEGSPAHREARRRRLKSAAF